MQLICIRVSHLWLRSLPCLILIFKFLLLPTHSFTAAQFCYWRHSQCHCFFLAVEYICVIRFCWRCFDNLRQSMTVKPFQVDPLLSMIFIMKEKHEILVLLMKILNILWSTILSIVNTFLSATVELHRCRCMWLSNFYTNITSTFSCVKIELMLATLLKKKNFQISIK